MVITIKSGEETDKIQLLLNKLSGSINEKESDKKKSVLHKTLGKINFIYPNLPLKYRKN